MIIPSFVFSGLPSRVVFGVDAFTAIGEEMNRLGVSRALVLTTPQQTDLGSRMIDAAGAMAVGRFSDAAMHTPVDISERAVSAFHDAGADCTIAIGGGSTTGLGKAIALRTRARQIAVPTTYAGSEMTPILGETKQGQKTTITDRRILPDTVIYDVSLTMTLPSGLTATSGLNALAHAVEALYARDRNPIVSVLSAEAISSLVAALPRLAIAPSDPDARAHALYGACLCGAALGAVGMALHHKLCHVLGGTLDLPHSETHAVVLPHATAFNAASSQAELAPVAEACGGEAPGAGLYSLARRIGAPRSLRELGMKESGIDVAADAAMQKPYWNPRPFDRDAIRSIIAAAWAGETPRG